MGGFLNFISKAASPIGAAIGAVGDVLGGAMASSAQNKANQTNLRIAQETNQANLDIMHENNNLARQMWEHELWYNSPAAQRAMMEQAGYNPYSLYANGQGFASSAPGVPGLQQAKMYAPTMMAEDAMGKQVSQVGNDLANTVLALAQAKNLKSQTDLNNIQKLSLGDILQTQLKGMGLDNASQEIQNYILDSTKDFTIESAEKAIDLMDNEIGFKAAERANLQLRTMLIDKYGEQFITAEISKKLNEAFKALEEGKTEESKRILNAALGHKAYVDADVEKFLAPYQAQELGSRASEESAHGDFLRESQKYLSVDASANIMRAWNDILNGRANRREIDANINVLKEAKRKAKIEADFAAENQLDGVIGMMERLRRWMNGGYGAAHTPTYPGQYTK